MHRSVTLRRPGRRIVSRRAVPLATPVLMLGLAIGSVDATELRDAELVAGGSAVLQDDAGTLRLEDARLKPVTFVPEPAALLQLGSGAALLVLLGARGRVRR